MLTLDLCAIIQGTPSKSIYQLVENPELINCRSGSFICGIEKCLAADLNLNYKNLYGNIKTKSISFLKNYHMKRQRKGLTS